MAKYYNSPWGEIRGTLCKITASRARGAICYIKAWTKTKVPGSKEQILKAKRGEIDMSELSPKQTNIARIGVGMSAKIATKILNSIIYPAWEPLTRGTKLTGRTLFIKRNASELYWSIPNQNEFYSHKNKPDIKQIKLTTGILEETKITHASYDPKTGELKVEWNNHCFNNGNQDDDAYIFAIHWKIKKTKDWTPDFEPWKTIKIWGDAINPIAKRKDEKGVICIEKELKTDPETQFIAYLSFKSTSPKQVFSESESSQITIATK